MSSVWNSLGRKLNKGSSKAPPLPNMPTSTGFAGGPGEGGTPGSSTSSVVQRGGAQGTPRPLFICKPYVNSHLLKGNFKTIVVLPKHVDIAEWIALNTFEFYEYLKLFHNTTLEFCAHCKTMSASPDPRDPTSHRIDYHWLGTDRKPVSLPAARYIEYVMTWINHRLMEESIFPTRPPNSLGAGQTQVIAAPRPPVPGPGQSGQVPIQVGRESGFPPEFFRTCQAIFKQMFRVFAHIYHAHFVNIVHLSMEAHLNSFFAHFIFFSREFGLLDPQDLGPLKELIAAFDERGMSQGIRDGWKLYY